MQVQSLELPPLHEGQAGDALAPASRLAALAGVKAQLTVVAGHASTTVGDLLALKSGAVLPLDTALNAPFDILLDGQLVARGELVAVGEQFGVRVVQVQAS